MELQQLSPPAYQLPPASPPPPPYRRECRTYAGPPSTARGKTYELQPLVLHPIAKGPTVAERPSVGFVRTRRDVRRMLEGGIPALEDCWRWASARGAAPTTVEVALTIDPFGDATDIAFSSAQPTDPSLLACVRQLYTGMRSPVVVAHATRVTAKLAFVRVDQPPPRRGARPPVKPTPPPPSEPRHGSICTPLVEVPPVDVAIETPIVITDFDLDRFHRMTPVQHGKLDLLRSDRLRCIAEDALDPDKIRVREAVMANHGAYQACYAAAYARDPALTGEVAMTLVFDPASAMPSSVTFGGAGDKDFHACLTDAALQIWLQPPALPAPLEVRWPLRLAPSRSATTVDEHLAIGDPQGALALLAQQLRRERAPAARCTLHLQVLLATAQAAPWLDDERMRGAIANLAAALATLTEKGRASCLGTVRSLDLVRWLARASTKPSHVFTTATWLRRQSMALPLAPYLPWGTYLRWTHAVALTGVDREAGRSVLVELEKDAEIGEQVTELLAHIDQEPSPLDALCP